MENNYLKSLSEKTKNLPESQNPFFQLQVLPSWFLIGAVNGKLDIDALIRNELASRGINKSGEWVGFEKSFKVWEIE